MHDPGHRRGADGDFAYYWGAATAPTVSNNTVTGFGYAGVSVYTSGGLYQGNALGGNAYGLRYIGSGILDATNNQWGDPTGPLDDSDDRASGGLYNPTALGSRVSDRVNYYPWTGTPPALTATPSGFAATPQNGALALRWDASAEATLGGYKLYYGTASGSYGTPVVLGKVATHTLTGLSNGRTYYLALSSLNGVGVESARTAEIAATPTATSTYTLTVAKAGTGNGTVTGPSIDCGSDCTENYTSGTSVTLTATATTGSTFTGWSGAGCSGTGSCIVTMDAAKTVTANFTAVAPTTYALTVSKTGTGNGTVTGPGIDCGSDCTENYTSGTSVTLSATADTGSSFAGWSGGCTGTDNCSVTMSAAQSVTATFNTPSEVRPETISAGLNYTCGLKSDGTAACWGVGYYGETTPPSGLFTQLSAGFWHTCGVRNGGTVACWGTGTTNSGSYPNYGQAIPPAGPFIQVSAGYVHTCGVKSDGTVACWGAGTTVTGSDPNYGQAIPPAGTFHPGQCGLLAYLRGEDRRHRRLLGGQRKRPGYSAGRHFYPTQRGQLPHLRSQDRRHRRLLGV